jgi:hypothetical protein
MFTTTDSGGRTVELIENGLSTPVMYENARQYADAMVQARLTENQEAYGLIRQGMSAVIPI